MPISCRLPAQVHALEIEEYMRDFSAPFFRRAGVADKARRPPPPHPPAAEAVGLRSACDGRAVQGGLSCSPPAMGARVRRVSARARARCCRPTRRAPQQGGLPATGRQRAHVPRLSCML